ncbi:hypothetical protein S40288_10864 [Stachybotrys chartarum IBT 40288]|nr:hypothetical protein S40288_10864 [Stachybotrys chartarum IBT 40288]
MARSSSTVAAPKVGNHVQDCCWASVCLWPITGVITDDDARLGHMSNGTDVFIGTSCSVPLAAAEKAEAAGFGVRQKYAKLQHAKALNLVVELLQGFTGLEPPELDPDPIERLTDVPSAGKAAKTDRFSVLNIQLHEGARVKAKPITEIAILLNVFTCSW